MPTIYTNSGNNSGCLAFFGVPFVAFGLFFAFVSARSMSNPAAKNPLAGVVFGCVFSLFGFLIMSVGIFGTKTKRDAIAARLQNPEQPWMWNKDWAQGRAPGQSGSSTLVGWIFTVIWNAVSWPVIFAVTQKPLRGKAMVLYAFAAIFPTVGIALLVGVIVQTLRRMRYGNTYLQLQTVPAPLGRKLKGTIGVSLPYPLPHGINLAFSCINRVTTGSGKDRTTSDYIRWQERKNLAPEQVVAGPSGATIPVEFNVPRDMPATNHDDSSNQILWMVRAEADVPGVNYDDIYEVPVFVTRESPSLQEWQSTQDEQARLHPATAPLRPSVQVSSAPEGGMQFYYPALRSPGSAIALTIVTLVFSAVEYLLITQHGPMVMVVILGLIDALLFIGTMNTWFGTARVVANANGVSLHTRTLGLGGSKSFPRLEIDSIYPKVTTQTSGARGTAWYTVTLKDLKGREYSVGKQIKDHNEAEWICEQMKQLANVKLKTAVGAR